MVVIISANVMTTLTSPPVTGAISLNNSKYFVGDIKFNAHATPYSFTSYIYLSAELSVVHILLESLLSGVVYINFSTR